MNKRYTSKPVEPLLHIKSKVKSQVKFKVDQGRAGTRSKIHQRFPLPQAHHRVE